jgi:AbiTii
MPSMCHCRSVTLLDDIVAGATGDKPVASLLRQLKVIASRTGSGKLAEWVDRELEGYASAEALPRYRGPFVVAALGHFIGPFRELQNFAIPVTTFPEDMRNGPLFNYYATDSIAEVERRAADGGAKLVWSADAVRYYNWAVARGKGSRIVTDDLVLAGVSQPIPAPTLVGIVDAVRTRVLDLALELERSAPDVGQPDAAPETNAQASQVINTSASSAAQMSPFRAST